MVRKSLSIVVLILCFGLMIMGCPKKTVVKEEPSVKKSEEVGKRDAERAVRERSETREAREKELAKMKEEEAKKEFEKSLVAKRTPGIEGEAFESPLLKDIRFDYDKYDIRSQDLEIIKENTALLKKYPNVTIQIEGHCDERGTAEYNLALGERRSNSAKNYLLSLGISGNRISTISYGKERPLDPGHHEEAWAKNRRAHFIILSK
jgi:peptidoglycan-associated lipoprotein